MTEQELESRLAKTEAIVQALAEAQEANTKAIAALIQDTSQIVELHRDLRGATRLGASAQRFGFWLLKWGALGAAAAAAYNHGIEWVMRIK